MDSKSTSYREGSNMQMSHSLEDSLVMLLRMVDAINSRPKVTCALGTGFNEIFDCRTAVLFKYASMDHLICSCETCFGILRSKSCLL